MAIKFGTSFELAFRRSLFSLFLLLIYLLIGSLLLSLFAQLEQSKKAAEACKGQRETQKEQRVDFERAEFLNTLWAESLAARSESDWSSVANAKLDAYERLLATVAASRGGNLCYGRPSHQWNFHSSFRSALLLLTTAGGGPLTEVPPEQLGPATKLFAALFSLLGIPLLLIHLEHSAKALAALIEANFESRPKWALLGLTAGGILLAAIAVDIWLVEDERDEEEHSFLDSLFTVFLAFFTISGSQLHQRLPAALLLPLLLFLYSLCGCFLATLLANIHRRMAPYEFAFANGFCGKIEKAVSDARLDQQQYGDDGGEEEGERGEAVTANGRHHWQGEVPVLRFGIGEDGGMLLEENGDGEPSTTATFLELHRKQSISTIPEEEDGQELNSQAEG